MDNEQLKAWTCSKCGAALPEIKCEESAVKCSRCGTVFHVPKAETRSGGVQISGNVVVQGDVVGGDKVVIQSSTTTFDSKSVGWLLKSFRRFRRIS